KNLRNMIFWDIAPEAVLDFFLAGSRRPWSRRIPASLRDDNMRRGRPGGSPGFTGRGGGAPPPRLLLTQVPSASQNSKNGDLRRNLFFATVSMTSAESFRAMLNLQH